MRKAREAVPGRARQVDPRMSFEINSRFHEAIAPWSGNRFLLDAIRRQNALRRLSEYHSFSDLKPESVKGSLNDHIAILAAIVAGSGLGGKPYPKRHARGRIRPASA